eukprot:gene12554-13841_t
MPVSKVNSPRGTFSNISMEELCEAVQLVLDALPDVPCGNGFCCGNNFLHGNGYCCGNDARTRTPRKLTPKRPLRWHLSLLKNCHDQLSASSGTTSSATTSSSHPSSTAARGLLNTNSSPNPVENFRKRFPAMSARGINHQALRQAVPKPRAWQTTNQVKSNQFKPYPVKETWTNDFCCIPYTWSNETPSTKLMESLRMAGLSKRKICFPKRFANHKEMCEQLEDVFPQLKECGGCLLLKSSGGGVARPLEKVPINWYNIRDIRGCFSRSACIYIRPIQKNVDMAEKSVVIPESGPEIKCIQCGTVMTPLLLAEQVKHCHSTIDLSDDHYSKPTLQVDEVAKPNCCACIFHDICLRQWRSTVSQGSSINCPVCRKPFKIIILCDTGKEVNENDGVTENKIDIHETLSDQHKKDTKVDNNGEESFMPVHVRRGYILEDGLSELQEMDDDEWCPSFKVHFVGESGVDTGRLSKEFLSLFYASLAESSLVTGKPQHLTLSQNKSLLLKGSYDALGKALSLALLGGFQVPNFFSKSLVNFVIQEDKMEDCESLILELPDSMAILKDKLLEILKCSEIKVLKNLTSSLNLPELSEVGYNKTGIKLSDKEDVISAVVKHIQVGSRAKEVQSFLKGLSKHGVLDVLRKYPAEAYQLFNTAKLDLQTVIDFFQPEWSVEGCNKRQKEDSIYYYWIKFLKECSRRTLQRCATKVGDLNSSEGVQTKDPTASTLNLEGVMQFITGSRHKPLSPCGSITFDHNSADQRKHVFANTCAMQLVIPVNEVYSGSYKSFIQEFTNDIFDAPDFGQV